MERRKEEIDKQKGNSRCYVRGPIDGSPYAQIDLKNRLRVRTAIENEETSMAIINDLDILLGDLAFTKAKYEENKKERLDKQCIEPEVGFYEIKTAPIPIKGESTLHKCCALHLPAKLQYMPSLVNGRDGFLNTNCSSNFKEFLFELDNSPLNAVSSSLVKGVKKSKYDYDGLTFDEFDFSLDNSLKETEKKEIVPGIVAQRVNLLSNVFFAENEYNRKMGIPLAGLAPTKEVIDKVTQFNSRSLASGFCSTDIDPCSRDSPRTNYNQPLIHLSGDKLLSNTYGNKYYGPDSIDVRDKSFSDDICVCDGYATILDDPLTSEIESSLKSESFPCTDSAYGESMRSSSSSPILSPLSNEEDAALNQPFTHGRESPIEMQDDSFWIQADYTSKNLLENKTFCKVNEHPSAVEVDPWYVDKSTEGSPTAASPKKEAQRKKGSLTIVEERIQPSHISQEVEHLNDEIFQHLVEFEKTMLEAGSPKTLQRMPKSNGILKPLSLKTEIMTNEYNQRTEKRPEDSPKLSLFPKSTIKRTVESDKNGVTDKSEIQPYYYNAPSNRSFERETVLSPKSPDLSGQKQPRLNGTISTKKVQCRPNGAFERTNVQHFDPSNSGDSSFESESSSSPKSTSSVVDSPQLPRFPRSISNLSAQQYVNGTLDRNRTLPYHHSVSADSAIGSECSSSPKSPDSTKFSSMRSRKYRGSGSSNSSASSAELFIEVARNPSVKFEKDTKNIWYKPNISREEAAELLRDKPPGSFIVRDSKSYIGAFGLAVKVEVLPISIIKQAGGDLSKLDMNNELVRHFLIEPCKKGVRLKGSTNEPTFSSLVALIYQHTLTKMALPITLVINDESDAVDGHNTRASTITESQLLIKGAACNLVYLGIVNVESLTGDGAVQYSMNKIIAANVNLRSTIVNIKVNQQGITFTDNNRKIFFRRHYPMEHVLHCGVDPKERLINLKTIVPDCDKEARVFGLVVRKPAKPLENECLMCAELDQDQPASAVINFIHKTMRYSQGIA